MSDRSKGRGLRLSAVLTAALALAMSLTVVAGGVPASTGGTELPPPPDLHGSVDCNGAVTAVDALMVLRFVGGLPVKQHDLCVPIGSPVRHDYWINAWGDIDCNGSVDARDAFLTLQYVAGLEVEAVVPAASIAGAVPSPTPVTSSWSCPPIGWDFSGSD